MELNRQNIVDAFDDQRTHNVPNRNSYCRGERVERGRDIFVGDWERVGLYRIRSIGILTHQFRWDDQETNCGGSHDDGNRVGFDMFSPVLDPIDGFRNFARRCESFIPNRSHLILNGICFYFRHGIRFLTVVCKTSYCISCTNRSRHGNRRCQKRHNDSGGRKSTNLSWACRKGTEALKIAVNKDKTANLRKTFFITLLPIC